MTSRGIGTRILVAVALVASAPTGRGETGAADLAQELTNPIADLVTVPIQMNFDDRIGPADDGSKLTTNVQPVIPFDIGENWNLVTRTIVPVTYQDDIFPGAGSQFGLGDINLSLNYAFYRDADAAASLAVGYKFGTGVDACRDVSFGFLDHQMDV